jgi:hypothetical protein
MFYTEVKEDSICRVDSSSGVLCASVLVKYSYFVRVFY